MAILGHCYSEKQKKIKCVEGKILFAESEHFFLLEKNDFSTLKSFLPETQSVLVISTRAYSLLVEMNRQGEGKFLIFPPLNQYQFPVELKTDLGNFHTTCWLLVKK